MTDINYKFEVGKEYKTRGGYVATILDANFKGHSGKSIAGKIKIKGGEFAYTWYHDGCYWGTKTEHPYDLMPPVETKEIWVNVYGGYTGCGAWSKKEHADAFVTHDYRIGLLKITITGDDFTVEKVAI